LQKRSTGWAPTTTHQMSKTKVYSAWAHIKGRCLCPTDRSFQFYGGRGITMCDEWKNSFKAFYDEVGNPPSPEHSIERINNTKGYEPGNVHWATRQEQCNNRRNSVRYNGMTIMQLSHKYQIHFERLKYLLRQRRLSLEDALQQCGITSTSP
jgi:Staphylococcus phage HNH endonuclease